MTIKQYMLKGMDQDVVRRFGTNIDQAYDNALLAMIQKALLELGDEFYEANLDGCYGMELLMMLGMFIPVMRRVDPSAHEELVKAMAQHLHVVVYG